MIQFVEMECPNCSGPLTKTGDNTAKCSHCGAEFLIDHDQPERITHVPPSPAPQNNNRSGILSVVTVFLLIAIGTICFIAPGHTGSEVLPEESGTSEAEGHIRRFFQSGCTKRHEKIKISGYRFGNDLWKCRIHIRYPGA